ncbi:hypothetical protein AYO21_02157 [Fonsecaea monophora]|uniref:C2H2-type domain-containing protein n=1 Tax=Fonsecaea monophora TaxID=254056 RepID=A0A177FIJ4_9EURO|nr:hypothetical protein AYO21_02157 [Fonsecaea monophora]OAG43571.1 hypothetical protein AYO21_02157 [Fonsecaea monophora]
MVTLFPYTRTWWNGGNIADKKVENMTYMNGIDVFMVEAAEKLKDLRDIVQERQLGGNLVPPADDEEEPLPKRQKRPAHQMYPFACPFYRRNKDLYSACLEDEENQVGDIDDIYRHVTRKHRAPDHYCPCCGVSFDNRASCDEHIRGRTCEAIYPAPSFQGLTSQMRVQLDQEFNMPTTGRDDDEKWFRVFNFLFPTERSQGISPYLDADEVRTKTLLSLKVYISERGGHDTRNAMTTMIDEFSEQSLLHSASLGGVITIADSNVGASSAAKPGQHVDEDARANAATTTAIRAISTTFRPPISESPWASSLPTGGSSTQARVDYD